MSEVVGLSLSSLPNKTSYIEGDHFEPYGMVVLAHYNDGSDSVVPFYSISPNGSLRTSDTNVVVSAFNLDISVPITVRAVPTSGYFTDVNLSSSEYGGNPGINTADGSIFFECSEITARSGLASFGVAIRYSSGMTEVESDLIKGLPKGFRTTLHQFLIQDGVDDRGDSTYKYIDDLGYVTRFFKSEDGFYYDGCGLRLRLDVNSKTITNPIGDSMSFDHEGRLTSIRSGANPLNEKLITYNDDGIRTVYDQRYPDTYIKFSYQFGWLRWIRVYQDGALSRLYTLMGVPGQISSIEEEASGQSRTIYQFSVNDRNLINRFVDCMTKDAYRLTYEFDTSLNGYRFSSMRKGYMAGGGFQERTGLFFAGAYYNHLHDRALFSRLLVEDENGVALSIMSDDKGMPVSILEEDANSQNEYYSIRRDSGIWLGDTGGSGDSINGSRSIYVCGNRFIASGLSSSDLGGRRNVKLTGWAKLSTFNGKSVIGVSGSGFVAGFVELNSCAVNTWQHFEVELSRDLNDDEPIPFNSVVVSSRNGLGQPVGCQLANLYFDRSTGKETIFFSNHNNPVQWREITELNLWSQTYGAALINLRFGDRALSESDFMETIISWHLSGNGGGTLWFSRGLPISFEDSMLSGSTDGDDYLGFMDGDVTNSSIGNGRDWFIATSADADTKKYLILRENGYEFLVRSRDGDGNVEERYEYDANRRLIRYVNKKGGSIEYEYFLDGTLKRKIARWNDGSERSAVLYQSEMDQDGRFFSRESSASRIRLYEQNNGLLTKTSFLRETLNGQETIMSAIEYGYDPYGTDITSVDFLDGERVAESHSHSRPSASYKTNYYTDGVSSLRVCRDIESNSVKVGVMGDGAYRDVFSMTSAELIQTSVFDNGTGDTARSEDITKEFDEYGNLKDIALRGSRAVEFHYSGNSSSEYGALLSSVCDGISGRTINFEHDESNRLTRMNDGDVDIRISTDDGGVAEVRFPAGDSYSYALGEEGAASIATGTANRLAASCWYIERDQLMRVSSIKNPNYDESLNHSFEYSLDDPSLITSYDFGSGAYSESYSYVSGKMSSRTASFLNSSSGVTRTHSCHYSYDGLGRIIHETNSKLRISRAYVYDQNGYMTYFGDNAIAYDECGRVSSFGDNSYSYDNYGNRVSRNGMTYRWVRGNVLSGVGPSSYYYDYGGRRITKVDSMNRTHQYHYLFNKLVGEDVSDASGIVSRIRYFYDSLGPCAMRTIDSYRGTIDYIYIRNASGDITGLMNQLGVIVCIYVYDAWGSHIVCDCEGNVNTSGSFIGNVNPFRYRGYYYDVETSLYYITSRYYDPEIGRFISPDSADYLEPTIINGLNLYAYCGNDPVNRVDPTGHDWINIGLTILSAAAIVGGIVLCATGVGGIAGGVLLGAGAGSLISGYVNEANNGSFVGGWVGGAISGALCGTGAGIGGSLFIAATETVDLATIGLLSAGVGTSFAGGFLGNFIGSSVTSIIDGNTIDYGRLALDSTVMGSLNIIAGFLSSASGITSATGRVETNLNSKFALRFVSGLIAGGTETIYDLVSWLYGKIRSNF